MSVLTEGFSLLLVVLTLALEFSILGNTWGFLLMSIIYQLDLHISQLKRVLVTIIFTTPKDNKYLFRSILPSDDVSMPLSKRCLRAQEAMSPCVAENEIALVEPVETGVTGQDDAYNISADEKYYTKFFDNDKKSVKGNEECVKVDTLIQKEAIEIGGSKNLWCIQIHINPL